MRRIGLITAKLLHLILGACLCFDANGLSAISRAMRNVNYFVVFGFAGADDNSVLFGHDVCS